MEDIINKYMEGNGSQSKATRTTMRSGLRRLERLLEKPLEDMTSNTFSDPEAMIEKILDDYSLNTGISTILVIKQVLKHLGAEKNEKLIKEYNEFMLELVNERNQAMMEQKKTPAEEKLGEDFDYQRMKDKFFKYIEGINGTKLSFQKARAILILALYLFQPPTRISNYLNMQVKRPSARLSKKKNYLLTDGDNVKFVFQDYKTSKHLGKQELRVTDPDLKSLINDYISKHPERERKATKNNPRRYGFEFLTTESGAPVSQSNFTNILKGITEKIYGVPLSVNNMRHIFLTWFLNQNPSLKEREKVAHIMGQTFRPSRAELYARRDEEDKEVLKNLKEM